MKVLALSDVHVDYRQNKTWLFDLCEQDNSDNILILAGDLTHDLKLLNQCFHKLSRSFLCVAFVSGNHELWTFGKHNRDSLQKFKSVNALAADHGVFTTPFQVNGIEITPIVGWYDYSFGTPCEKLAKSWMDFHACSWPDNMSIPEVNQWFIDQNRTSQSGGCQYKISFSHFLPRIDLLPDFIPASFRYLNPVMGSSLIEKKIRQNKSNVHVYGHSHINQDVVIEGIRYINNATGYPREKNYINRKIKCIYQSEYQLDMSKS